MSDLFSRKDLVYTVYQEGSFSHAAQKLYISQPSLSTMIRKVEEDVGLPLFDRTCKPVRLTETGRAYIRATEEIQHIERSFYNYVCAVNNLQAGSLGIGSNQLFSSLVLPRYVSRFIARYPKIQLNLVDANSAELEELIAAGQLDLIIDNRELDPAHYDRRPLQKEYLLLAVPANFPSNRGLEAYQMSFQDILDDRHASDEVKPVPLTAFAADPFILMTRDNDTRGRTNAIFQEAGLEPQVILEIDRLVTLYNFIIMGTADVIVSDTLIKNVRDRAENAVFYKFPDEHALRELYIHSKKNKYTSRAMESFVEILTEE